MRIMFVHDFWSKLEIEDSFGKDTILLNKTALFEVIGISRDNDTFEMFFCFFDLFKDGFIELLIGYFEERPFIK